MGMKNTLFKLKISKATLKLGIYSSYNSMIQNIFKIAEKIIMFKIDIQTFFDYIIEL